MTWVIIDPFLSFLQLLEFLKSLYITKCMLIFSIMIFWVTGSLGNGQFGFRSMHSTALALVKVTNKYLAVESEWWKNELCCSS